MTGLCNQLLNICERAKRKYSKSFIFAQISTIYPCDEFWTCFGTYVTSSSKVTSEANICGPNQGAGNNTNLQIKDKAS